MLVNLNPSFMRFPGGSWVNGLNLSNAYHWKPTVGFLPDRTVRTNVWHYMVDNGLGYHEYLQLCEDLGAEPLFDVNAGMAGDDVVAPANLGPWVREALDAIEYANGGTNTTYGAMRAANGHPAPFHLKYIEIGNENGGPAYNANYAVFYDAIKSNYPAMHIIANVWGGIPSSRPVEIMDEHYYHNAAWFEQNAAKYDNYSRTGSKVFVGEYAVAYNIGPGFLATLNNALGEAAFMTGMERNSDVVEMACYAPLFANWNRQSWTPDLIYFDGTQVYGTPSYYVQQMFAQNRGDVVLPTAVSVTSSAAGFKPHGAIGVGSWNTAVQYTNIVVTSNGVTLYRSDFAGQGANGWRVFNGAWSPHAGLYRQSSTTTADCRATVGSTGWANYTLSLRARKTGGSEGFLVLFDWQDDDNWLWWNVGGWNNTKDAIELNSNGTKTTLAQVSQPAIADNVWHDIRIQLDGTNITCYLDGAL
ncbi:MAG TPA: alpha-L-arabinofuranosidase C-terminal domain-containing protein, partial [Candidatus Binatia bacterium]|nr:alpha-L-arabinofuranosidase C-terminal domain-containing protein [Candidatus Binatia bacterium]